MAIFAIISTEAKEELKAAVETNFKDVNFEISPSQFLVNVSKMTANQVSVKLGAPSGTLGRILIFLVTDYGGWHSKEIWAWITAQIVPPTILPPEEPKSD